LHVLIGDDLVNELFVPILRVSERELWPVGGADALQFAQGGGDLNRPGFDGGSGVLISA
jgi:hypothetical protein